MAKKTLGQRLRSLFSGGTQNAEFFEELEDLLIESDLGAQFTMEISDRLQSSGTYKTREETIAALREMILSEISAADIDSTGIN